MEITPNEFLHLVQHTLPNYLKYKLVQELKMNEFEFEDELQDFEIDDLELLDMTTNTFNDFGRGNKTTKWKKDNVVDENIFKSLKENKRNKNERTDI